MNLKHTIIFFILTHFSIGIIAQKNANDSVLTSNNLVEKVSQFPTEQLNKTYSRFDRQLTKSLNKYLTRIEKKESVLKKKLASTDSISANKLFNASASKINEFRVKLDSPLLGIKNKLGVNYNAKLDSLHTLASFFSNSSFSKNLPIEQINQIKTFQSQITNLQSHINTANEIKAFLAEQKQTLKQHFEKLGATKVLEKYNREVFYYQQQFKEYKELLNDPDKLTRRLLTFASSNSVFQEFMRQNSQLAQLFRLPGTSSVAGATNGIPIAGLQTRDMVQQQISQTMPGGNVNPQQYMQQQVSAAEGELNTLKDKVNQMGGGSDELEMPDFKPNNQRTKPFLKRIEIGLNIQSQRSNSFFPTTTDFGLQAGYKLSEKGTIGIGASYKLGWGKNINNISLSSEGLGLRSFLDIKFKGSIWIIGGYEMNYNNGFISIPELKEISAWQRSGLIGISKKYSIGKKKGNMQLLWDFLSYSQVPRTQAIKFRLGYTL